MKSITSLLLSGLLTATTAPALADNQRGHVLLSGYAQRGGSLGPDGADATEVYLFVDEVEGRLDLSLPATATLTLERNGVPLPGFTNVPAAAVMTVPQIAALYGPTSEWRRLAQTRTALDGALAYDAPVTAATFAQRLHDALATYAGSALPAAPVAAQGQPLSPAQQAIADALTLHTWSVLATRVDPNVASARFRGFIDRAPPTLSAPLVVDADEGASAAYTVNPGHVYYRLVVTDGGRQADLGRIDVSLSPHTLPAPVGFDDVSRDQSRCDAPESGRTQGVVALTWEHPGANASEVFAHMQNTTGYDLWRTAGPCSDPGDVDLRTLMLTADGTGEDGRLMVPGFSQVNDMPILIRPTPAGGREHERDGWNAAFSQWIDDRQALEAAGFSPGDQLCYYVVGLDRTGNYGATAGIAVTIPDVVAPIGPWSIEAVPESEATGATSDVGLNDYDTTVTHVDSFHLEWRAVDAKNWLSDSANGRVACNLDAAVTSGRLLIADTIQGCDDPRALNLDVDSYRVYRFNDDAAAAAFVDSDGDGYSDADERPTLNGKPDLDQLGSACDPNTHTGVNHLANGRFRQRLDADGTLRIQWVDDSLDGPANKPGEVFWYRVASHGRNGVVSELGPPVRGLFVDLKKPDRFRGVKYGFCGPEVALAPVADQGAFALDTTGQAVELRLYCMPQESEGGPVIFGPPAPDAFVERIRNWVASYDYVPLVEGFPGAGGSVPRQPREAICTLSQSAGCRIEAEVVDAKGRTIGKVTVPGADDCDFTVESENNCQGGFTEVVQGDVVDQPLELTLPLEDGECAGVFGTIGDKQYRLTTLCGNDNHLKIDPPDFGPSFSCLSVTRYSTTSRTPSTDTALPCVTQQLPSTVPPPPRLASLGLDPDTDFGELAWFAPEQAIGGIIVEFWESKKGKRGSDYFALDTAPGSTIEHRSKFAFEGVLAQGDEEEWCIRAQAVAAATSKDLGGKLSPWTSPFCGSRKRAPAGNLPDYLPWPAMRVPALVDEPLALEYFRNDGLFGIRLATIAPDSNDMPRAIDGVTDPSDEEALCGYRPSNCNPGVGACTCSTMDYCDKLATGHVSCNMCAAVHKAMGNNFRFVAYRQSRTPDPDGAGPLGPELGPFIQVTPMLDGGFCALDFYDRRGEQRLGYRFWDPFYALIAFAADNGDPDAQEFRVYFTDRVPHEIGLQYRYQFVYFDASGEPTEYRQSGWKEVPQ